MKTKFLTLFAALALFAGCSDDDASDTTGGQAQQEQQATTSLSFAQGTASAADVKSNQESLSISIVTVGEWTASVAGEDDAWIRILNEKGTGNAQINVRLDLNASDERREGKIEIKSGAQTLTYTVAQGTLFEENAENEINYASFDKRNVPLGFAMRIKKKGNNGLPTKQVIDLKGWNSLTDDKKESIGMDEDYVSEYAAPTTNIKLQTAKSYEDQQQVIGATASVTIGFGLLKLGLNGGFNLNRHSEGSNYKYGAATTIPTKTYAIDNYEGYMSNALALDPQDDEQKALRKTVLGGDFIKLYDKIAACYNEDGEIENADELQKQLQKLDKDFGPIFCHEGTKGGSASITVTGSMVAGTDSMSINGKLTVGFNSAFNLDVKATAEYLSVKNDSITSLDTQIEISGGNLATHDDVTLSVQDILQDPSKINENTSKLLSALGDWRKSLDDSNTVLTEYQLTGIWELFKHSNGDIEEAMQESIKAYMRKAYPNERKMENGKEVVACPYLVNIEEMTE